MVRTSRPLVERMTLVWHDWFATSNERRRQPEADAQAEQAVPQPLARLVRAIADRRDSRPGDAPLAERHLQLEGRTERELRAGDDGALHARRRPRRLHRARRARAGAVADGLPERLEARARRLQLPLRSAPARHGDEGGVPEVGALRLEVARATSASRTRCTRPSSCASSGATSCRSLPTTRRRLRSRRCIATAITCSPSSRRSCKHPAVYDRAADGQAAGRPCRRPAAPDRCRHHEHRLVVDRIALRASSSSIRRTSPAGTTRAGSTPRRTAAAGSPCSGSCRTASSIPPRARSRPMRRRC